MVNLNVPGLSSKYKFHIQPLRSFFGRNTWSANCTSVALCVFQFFSILGTNFRVETNLTINTHIQENTWRILNKCLRKNM